MKTKNNGHVRVSTNHPAPVKTVIFGQLYINDDQLRLNVTILLHDFAEILYAIYVIRPLGQPFLDLAE